MAAAFQIFTQPSQQALDTAANVLSGATLTFTLTGTSTATNAYSDSALTTPVSNPLAANSSGVWPPIFLDPTITYRIVLKTAAGATLQTWDPANESVLNQALIGFILYPRSAAEISAGVTPVNYLYPYGYVDRFATNAIPGTTDMTTALDNCYASCKAAVRIAMRLFGTSYLYTTKRVWDGSVDVLGANSEFTILLKSGNIDGFEISGSAQQSTYQDFTVQATGTIGTGRGGLVTAAAHLTMRRVTFTGHGSHGLHLLSTPATGYFSEYHNITCVSNGGDGVRIDGHYAANWNAIDSRGNTGWGFNLLTPSAYHSGRHIVCQQNTAGGSQVAGQQNALELYGESNTGVDISLTATSVRNLITNLHVDSYPADLVDLGTDNILLSISGVGGILTPAVTRPKRTTNVAGLGLSISGGAAGAGGSPFSGGVVSVNGGDAAGTGNADGGGINLRGGSGVGTGREGNLVIQESTGLAVIGAASPPTAKAKLAIVSTTLGFQPPRMTTTQKNAITPSGSDNLVIFDITLGKLCISNNSGSWETVTSV